MPLHPIIAMCLAGVTPPAPTKQDILRRVFDDRRACEGCPRYEIQHDSVPYSEGWTRMAHEVCTLGEGASDKPEDCPAFDDYVKENEE